MLIDSHSHLQDGKFSRDLGAVLARAEAAAVEYHICIGDRLESSRRGLDLARRNPRIRAAVGIHPHHDALFSEAALHDLAGLARDPAVVAVGEIGLDFHYPGFDAARQQAAFVAQARLAADLGLPIVIHCRDAYDELYEIIRADPSIQRHGVLHCFGGTPDQAGRYLDLGYHLGVGGSITYPGSEDLRETVRRFGLARVISETDAPYLTPQVKRGRRNEPSYMKYAVQSLADAAGVSYQEAARATRDNALDLFNLPREIAGDHADLLRKKLYVPLAAARTAPTAFDTDYLTINHRLDCDRDPNADEILSRIESPGDFAEIVLGGGSEPAQRWDFCLRVARELKRRGAIVALETDGLGCIANRRDIVPDMAGIFDSVLIHMIAHDPTTRQKFTGDPHADRHFAAMIDFAERSKSVVPDVALYLVARPEANVEIGRKLAEETLQIQFRVREDRTR